MKFHNFLKKNQEIEKRIKEARQLGIQTLIDKLLGIFNHQEIENPNQILWIREKTSFIKWLAGKVTDLYSDNKVQEVKQQTNITYGWQSEPIDIESIEAEIENPTSISKD